MGFDDRIRTLIDSDLKREAVKIFQQHGITEEEAIRMFYAQVNLLKGLPFNINIPNQETVESMKEGEKTENLPTFNRFSDLRKEIGI
ncbi:MAG: type II toxin-antitoxin system RelB/DinJ family antitoxin [Candidatus Omnitrophota bacterium]